MDNFGFEGDSDEEEERSDNCKSSASSEEERDCQPDMERVLINPYR